MAALDLSFLGAVGTVTGSRYLVEAGDVRCLVDCGLFQGLKQLRLRNRAPFPVPPASIAAVVLTHAHLDHTGYLPLLVREGFAGPVHCTAATAELCGILLPDSGHLQEAEAERANRHGYSKHHPALPLYTLADAKRALEQLRPVPLETETPLAGEATFRFRRAGHILGSATATVSRGGRTILFSGDLGRPEHPVLRPPAPPPAADWVLIESTYGDRSHGPVDPRDELADVLRRTLGRGGVVVIPAFAVGRTQTVLYHIHELFAAGEIPRVPVFIDSPMAGAATEIFLRHGDEHTLDPETVAALRRTAEVTRDVEASKAIDRRVGPMIVISASGMASGGRVLFHLRRFAPDHRNTILFVGFQAAGTRGEAMLAGAETIRIHGGDVPVRADVVSLDGLSAHADADELLAWLRQMPAPPRQVFVTHGEPVAADRLRFRIENELGWPARVPEHGEKVSLG